jgi:light-regulated signal transduction histidine kinase (bacteriophytochrome)
MIEQARLIIVDGEAAHLRALCEVLQAEGYITADFPSAKQALKDFQRGGKTLLLTDLLMPEMNGIEFIRAARAIDPDLAAIVMVGEASVEAAARAMQDEPLDFIVKPFRSNLILPVIARVLAVHRRERQRSAELLAASEALGSFSHSVSHDLRAPLRGIDSLVQIMEEDYGERLGEEGRGVLSVIRDGCRRMDVLISGLLAFSESTRQPLNRSAIDMTSLAHAALSEAMSVHSGPRPVVEIASLPASTGDVTLMRRVWLNLIDNALKFSSKRAQPKIQVSGHTHGRETVYQVDDNGSGFDMKYARRLFGVFQRLHRIEDFSGAGVGLAIAQRIIVRHGGRIWAQATPEVGASFQFTLPIVEITD